MYFSWRYRKMIFQGYEIDDFPPYKTEEELFAAERRARAVHTPRPEEPRPEEPRTNPGNETPKTDEAR